MERRKIDMLKNKTEEEIFLFLGRDENYMRELTRGFLKLWLFKRGSRKCKDPEEGTCLLLFKN